MSKPHRMIAQCPAPPGKIKILLVLAKEFQNMAIKPFPWCAISHENQSLKYFVTDCTSVVMLEISINFEEFQLEQFHLAYRL